MPPRFIDTNGIRLHVVEKAPANGPLVILLHGFPEFSSGWRSQIDVLAGAGFRVWVPDHRGYNLNDKPVGISAYTIDKLVADVVGLIDAAGQEKATVIGHDWGASCILVAGSNVPTPPEQAHLPERTALCHYASLSSLQSPPITA